MMKKQHLKSNMDIIIRKPLGYSYIGLKDRQEDAVWPLFEEATEKNTCFVLCDGVGGSMHGEIASQVSCKIIGCYLTKIIEEKRIVVDTDIHQSVSLAYDELEKIELDDSSGKISMATTLACVCIHKEGIIAGHIGDSRIYHIRPNQGLLYQSADHSLVNALLQAGEITIEEAKNFASKNVITKAIQPYSRRIRAEVHQLTDIQSGDYLFLCSDGVLERLTNDRLVEILSMNISDIEKLSLLEKESIDKTKDNFTAYLIPIGQVNGLSSIDVTDESKEAVVTSVIPIPEKIEEYVNNNEKESYNYRNNYYIIYAFILLLMVILSVVFFIS